MIDREQLAATARGLDDSVDTVEVWLRENNIDEDGMAHVAEQRAMRALMIFKGLKITEFEQFINARRNLDFTSDEHEALVILASVWVDGFANGFTVSP